MKKLLFLVCVISTIAACDIGIRKPSFSIVTPAGWTRVDTNSHSGDTIIRFKPTEDTAGLPSEKIAIVIVHSVDPGAFVQSMMEKLHNDADIFEETGKGNRMIDGEECKWLQCTVKYKTSKVQVDQRLYFFPKNGFMYTFICTAAKGEFEQLRPVVDGLINSFKTLQM